MSLIVDKMVLSRIRPKYFSFHVDIQRLTLDTDLKISLGRGREATSFSARGSAWRLASEGSWVVTSVLSSV